MTTSRFTFVAEKLSITISLPRSSFVSRRSGWEGKIKNDNFCSGCFASLIHLGSTTCWDCTEETASTHPFSTQMGLVDSNTSNCCASFLSSIVLLTRTSLLSIYSSTGKSYWVWVIGNVTVTGSVSSPSALTVLDWLFLTVISWCWFGVVNQEISSSGWFVSGGVNSTSSNPSGKEFFVVWTKGTVSSVSASR